MSPNSSFTLFLNFVLHLVRDSLLVCLLVAGQTGRRRGPPWSLKAAFEQRGGGHG